MSTAIPNTGCIFVEGAPGMGKTTTSFALRDRMAGVHHIRAFLCHENDNPLHAFWTWGDGYNREETVDVPYSSAIFIERLIERTDQFVGSLSPEGLAIVETYPFQSPVRNILKMLGTMQNCREYFSRFCDSVGVCDPTLVYLESELWSQRLLDLVPSRGERFQDVFFDAFYRSPYGIEHGITSPEGVISFYESYLSMCRDLLEQWPFRLVRFDPIAIGIESTVDYIIEKCDEA